MHLTCLFKLHHHIIHSHASLFLFSLSLTYRMNCLTNDSLLSYTPMHTTTWLLLFTTHTFLFNNNDLLKYSHTIFLSFRWMREKKAFIIVNSIVQKRKHALFLIALCRSMNYYEQHSVEAWNSNSIMAGAANVQESRWSGKINRCKNKTSWGQTFLNWKCMGVHVFY